MIVFAVVLALAGGSAGNYSCEDVQAYVQAHGRAASWAKALEMLANRQMTWAQFRAAKRCADAPKGKG